jgi:hypothetical protein
MTPYNCEGSTGNPVLETVSKLNSPRAAAGLQTPPTRTKHQRQRSPWGRLAEEVAAVAPDANHAGDRLDGYFVKSTIDAGRGGVHSRSSPAHVTRSNPVFGSTFRHFFMLLSQLDSPIAQKDGIIARKVVARDGIEPPTPAFSGPRSTTELSGLGDDRSCAWTCQDSIHARCHFIQFHPVRWN